MSKPQWQLPTDNMPDGWYWVERADFPCYVERTEDCFVHENGTWSVSGWDSTGAGWDYRPLGNRRVAPCTGRPE